MVGAGRVRPRPDDHEIGPGMPLGDDRRGDVGGDLALGPAGPEPARNPAMHPVDRGPRLPQRRDLGRGLAYPQPAQGGAGHHLAGARQRVTEPEHHRGPHLVRQPDRLRAAEPASDQAVRIVGLVPADDLHAQAAGGRGLHRPQLETRRNQERRPVGRHRQAGQPLGRHGLVARQVPQVRPGRQQQRTDPGPGGRRGGEHDPVRRVQVRQLGRRRRACVNSCLRHLPALRRWPASGVI